MSLELSIQTKSIGCTVIMKALEMNRVDYKIIKNRRVHDNALGKLLSVNKEEEVVSKECMHAC